MGNGLPLQPKQGVPEVRLGQETPNVHVDEDRKPTQRQGNAQVPVSVAH
jgi:hypothetical protein